MTHFFFRNDEKLAEVYQSVVAEILAKTPGIFESNLRQEMQAAGLRVPYPGEFRAVLTSLGANVVKNGRTTRYS